MARSFRARITIAGSANFSFRPTDASGFSRFVLNSSLVHQTVRFIRRSEIMRACDRRVKRKENLKKGGRKLSGLRVKADYRRGERYYLRKKGQTDPAE